MKETYDIIRLILSKREYYQRFSGEFYIEKAEKFKKYFPDRTADEERKDDESKYDNYLELNIPMGCSRIGGPVVDLPDDIEYPEGYYFMAQLNCAEIKPFDKIGLLPKEGFIYFFTRDYLDNGHVFYTPKGKKSLHRVTKEHEENYYSGKIIEKYKMEIETISSKYKMENGKKEWDDFAGEEVSKIYGIYTNCQASEEEILQFMENENRIILLQIGSDYAGEGCQSVFINKDDLMKKDFTKCIFEYNQS